MKVDLRGEIPTSPASSINRATRFLPTCVPFAASSAWRRGAPYVPRDSSCAASSCADSTTSSLARVDSGRSTEA